MLGVCTFESRKKLALLVKSDPYVSGTTGQRRIEPGFGNSFDFEFGFEFDIDSGSE